MESERMTTVQAEFVAAVRARGCDANDVRDAAHEAHHALSAKVKGEWTRGNIDRAVQRKGRAWAVRDEALARAVEQIVCADLGAKTEPLTHWVFIACMESIKIDRVRIDPDLLLRLANDAIQDGRARKAADRVLAARLSSPPATKTKGGG